MNEEFVVFLDETGDHSLQHIDTEYPIFGLGALFCRYDDYVRHINPIFDDLKYKYFHKRHVVLHSTDIRRRRKDFNILLNSDTRERFFNDLNGAMKESPFYFVMSLVDKLKHSEQYVDPDNPYDLTLSFIMERSYFLIRKKYPHAKCRFIAESRDHAENDRLLKTFEYYKNSGTAFVTAAELEFISSLDFVRKEENETGHQIVDLCLYPFARTYLKGECHPSVPVFYNKIYKNLNNGSPIGYGIKTFPRHISSSLIEEIERKCRQDQSSE
ncbi:DUF3800 domain-containing protein [Peribacillus frigoritolerans]|uniref:DUF3800 domain-containing protein n=1 Tax=Peribacillus frigoritolerans TaxID=450367 RepID=UPI003D06489C